jgi:glutathione S-transferase
MYLVHGLTRSYFTRKMTGYLDYTDRPWRLAPMGPEPAGHPAANAAGWTGAIPVVDTPSGQPMWDSTSMIEHLDQAPDLPAGRGVLPDDPTLRFLAYLLDDLSDEWFYRPAVGSRWCYDANTVTAGWQLAEELAVQVPVPGAIVRQMVVATMTGSLGRIGIQADQIDVWMSEVVVPWFRALDAHLRADAGGGYLFGERPSIADFAVFGANAAHFVGDPYCRELADEHGPSVVAHTHRLRLPQEQTFGPWLDPGDVPPTLVAIVAEAGRHYLPWVAEATVVGSAVVELADGVTARIESSRFLEWARGVLLARYVELRCDALDAVLEEAGVLRYFADHLDQATAVPDAATLPQPSDNRPYATR